MSDERGSESGIDGDGSLLERVRLLARRVGVDSPVEVGDGVDWALPLVRALMERGVNVLIKFDGDRSADPVTVVVSGRLQGDEFVRRDGTSAGDTLVEVFAEIALGGRNSPIS